MIGFEIKSEKENLKAGLEEGVVSVIFTRVKNEEIDRMDLSISGLTMEKEENHKWIDRDLTIGEKFKIKVVEISNASPSQKLQRAPLEKLSVDDKLRKYLKLKKELEARGLI